MHPPSSTFFRSYHVFDVHCLDGTTLPMAIKQTNAVRREEGGREVVWSGQERAVVVKGRDGGEDVEKKQGGSWGDGFC